MSKHEREPSKTERILAEAARQTAEGAAQIKVPEGITVDPGTKEALRKLGFYPVVRTTRGETELIRVTPSGEVQNG